MVIVLIHWKIKPEQEMVDKFLHFWRQDAVVEDRPRSGRRILDGSTFNCGLQLDQLAIDGMRR